MTDSDEQRICQEIATGQEECFCPLTMDVIFSTYKRLYGALGTPMGLDWDTFRMACIALAGNSKLRSEIKELLERVKKLEKQIGENHNKTGGPPMT